MNTHYICPIQNNKVMKVYSSTQGKAKQPRRRLGEQKKSTVQEMNTFTKREQVSLKIAAAFAAAGYGKYE